jgi:tetratricopeptide (TPR) repeat protein
LRRQPEIEPAVDSPLFQLLDGYEAPDIARLKTDIFREQVQYAVDIKGRLVEARERHDAETLYEIEKKLGPFDSVEAGVLVDLFLSYRALQDWDRMIDLYQRLPAVLQRSVLVREQFGFALNRAGNRTQALHVFEGVINEQGPSSETCGLIGRVYKDQWVEQTRNGNEFAAKGFLDKAIKAYVAGFEADWRDAYPGINAVTLLDIRGDDASLQQKSEVLPVVRFAVIQRIRSSTPDYWDYATLLELAVLDNDSATAQQHLGSALSSVRETWEPSTTANNLRLIRDARGSRNMAEDWLDEIIAALERTAV